MAKSITQRSDWLSRMLGATMEGPLPLLLLIFAFAGGIVALMITAREEEPQIVVPMADVLVAAPGLSAEQVERQIATPLEKLLHQIDGVEHVYSMSRPDQCVVTVRFFVAECKYWKGEKTYLKTIDQLLGYLTWRNSKVAVINFVQNNEFSDVLEKTKTSTKTHPNFLKELNSNDETWFNYKFYLNGD